MFDASSPQVGAYLRASRRGAGLSLRAMAARCGVSKSALDRYEKEQREASEEFLATFARAIADLAAERRAAAA